MESRSVLVVMAESHRLRSPDEVNHRTRMLGAEQISVQRQARTQRTNFSRPPMLNTRLGQLRRHPVHQPNRASGAISGMRKTLPTLEPPTHRLHEDAWRRPFLLIPRQGLGEVSRPESHGPIHTLGLGRKTQCDAAPIIPATCHGILKTPANANASCSHCPNCTSPVASPCPGKSTNTTEPAWGKRSSNTCIQTRRDLPCPWSRSQLVVPLPFRIQAASRPSASCQHPK